MKKILCFMLIMLSVALIAGPPHGGRGRRGGHGGPPPNRHYHYHHHGWSGSDRGLWRANQIIGIVANGLGIVRNLSYPRYYYNYPTAYPTVQYFEQTPTVIYTQPNTIPATVVVPQQTVTYPEIVSEPVYQYQIINGRRVLVRIR